MHYSRTEYTRFSSNECFDVGLSELEAMSVLAGPRLLADDGALGNYSLPPKRFFAKLTQYPHFKERDSESLS
jgi:hypothetical protein